MCSLSFVNLPACVHEYPPWDGPTPVFLSATLGAEKAQNLPVVTVRAYDRFVDVVDARPERATGSPIVAKVCTSDSEGRTVGDDGSCCGGVLCLLRRMHAVRNRHVRGQTLVED